MGGIAFWSPNDDDPTGKCGLGSYPLLQAVRSVLSKPIIDINYANRTISNSTAIAPAPSFVAVIEKYGNVERVSDEDYGDAPVPLPCTRSGYLKHPKDCSRFYRCVSFEDSAIADSSAVQKFQYGCPPGLIFDEQYEICNWPSWSPSCTGSGEILNVQKKKFVCPSYGYFQDPSDCAFFYYCSDFGKSNLQAYEFKCPFDLAFDEEKLLCNWKWLVKGCKEAANPESHDLNNFNGFLDGEKSDQLDANNQGLDGDNDEFMERSDDGEVEFVDSPAEHRAEDGSYSFSKTESGRKGFARSIKDAIDNVATKVKSMVGLQAEPDKRQDFDPMLLEESVLSNWFSGLNPFGYGNTFAHQLPPMAKSALPARSLLHPSRASHSSKKGEQFISIPIIEVLDHAHQGPKSQRSRPGAGGHKHRPDSRHPANIQIPLNLRTKPTPGHRHTLKQLQQQGQQGQHLHQHPHQHGGGGNRKQQGGHRQSPATPPQRPANKKPQQEQSIPVPILTVRDPKPGSNEPHFHLPIQRRPDGDGPHIVLKPLATTPGQKQYAIITLKPTRRLNNRPRAEPEPEAEPKPRHRHPRPEPEPEAEPQRHQRPHPTSAEHRDHMLHQHGGHQIQAQPSINHMRREPPPPQRFNSLPLKTGPSVNSLHSTLRPKQQQQQQKGLSGPRNILKGMPAELFANYDVDVKALDVHPLFTSGGNVDLSQLQFLPSLGDAMSEALHTTKRPFGLPSASSPGRHPDNEGVQRQQQQQKLQLKNVLNRQQQPPQVRPREQARQPQLPVAPQQQQQQRQHPPPQPQHNHKQAPQPQLKQRPQEHHQQVRPQQQQQALPLRAHQQMTINLGPQMKLPLQPVLSQQAAQYQQQQQQQNAAPLPHDGNRPQFTNNGQGHYQPQPSNVHSHYQTHQPQAQVHRPQEPLMPLLNQGSQSSNNAITKNGFKPISPVGGQYVQAANAGQPQQAYSSHHNVQSPIQLQQQQQVVKPNTNVHAPASSSQHFNMFANSNNNGKVVSTSSATTISATSATRQQATWASSTARPATSSDIGQKTTKSSLLIIPVPDDHPKANTLNDLIRMSKEYPHLFPHGFDFSKVASVTRTKATPTGQSQPQFAGQGQGQVKNETKSDYIMVVVNEEADNQDPQRLSSNTASSSTPRPAVALHQGANFAQNNRVIKVDIPAGKPDVVNSIVQKVKESLATVGSKPAGSSPLHIAVTATIAGGQASGVTTPSPSPASGTEQGDNYFDNKNIPQSLYESIQQVIAQHLYTQHIQAQAATLAAGSTSGSAPTSSESTTTTPAPVTATSTPQSPTTTSSGEQVANSSAPANVLLEQIPYNYYYHPNASQGETAHIASAWPYAPQNPWFQHPAYNPYYPQPVYPQPQTTGNQSHAGYYPYPQYNPYAQQWPQGAGNGSYPAWYEWPYVSAAPVTGNETATTTNLDNHRLPGSFYITTTITTLSPTLLVSTTETPLVAESTFGDSTRLGSTNRRRQQTLARVPTTTPVPTTTYSSAAEATTTTTTSEDEKFDLLRTKSNSDAPQIQVYIVQGPNGPQVQTKTVNSKDGSKQPNVQVYVIDENSKDKSSLAYNHYAHQSNNANNKNNGDLIKSQSHNSNQYYQYSHNNNNNGGNGHLQGEESQLNKQTTTRPSDEHEHESHYSDNSAYRDIEYEDEDQADSVGTGSGTDSRVPYSQFLPANKVQSLQSLYNSQTYPNLRNFTDGSVPESACTRPGLFQHPADCNKFYECYYDRFVNKYTLHLFECPVKLAFDSRIVGCSGPTDPTVCVQY